jgi:predicted secreted protein
MNPVTGAAMYVMIWWLTLFAVLPFGTRPVADADSDTGWRGVPERPRLLRKVLVTTLVAAVIWGFCYLVIRSDWLSFRHGWLALPTD